MCIAPGTDCERRFVWQAAALKYSMKDSTYCCCGQLHKRNTDYKRHYLA